jgi:hypothetical protein
MLKLLGRKYRGVHGLGARATSATLVIVGLLIIIFGWNNFDAFKIGIVMAACGNALRLVNIGNSAKHDFPSDEVVEPDNGSPPATGR